jgi:predicted  nucleic acid-binding Zn-ribbon protein
MSTLAEKQRDDYKKRMNIANTELGKFVQKYSELQKYIEDLEKRFDTHKLEAHKMKQLYNKLLSDANTEKQNILNENRDLKMKLRANRNDNN